jgi:hypothetical protein
MGDRTEDTEVATVFGGATAVGASMFLISHPGRTVSKHRKLLHV